MSMEKGACIYVAGAETLIGAALVRRLRAQGYTGVLGLDDAPDPADAAGVEAFFARQRPAYVFVAAGKSGGIAANQKRPASLMLDNLRVNANLIDAAHRHGAAKLLYLASSCSYPKHAPQPMHPRSLMTGPLEPTNEAYAVAKIAGLVLCQAYRREYGANFIVGIPANAFGPGDDFHPEEAHVIAALMRRMHAARLSGAPAVEVWGTGTPRREFVFADDLADACIFVMDRYDGEEPINLGGGEEVSIIALARMVQEVVGYAGALRLDTSRPDGMPLKALDSSRLAAMGWRPQTPFRRALEATYAWYLEHV